jgi:NAD(P)H-dependent FMN reductase
VIGSTRPGRVGEPIARWFYDQALAHDGFAVELIDLAVVNLPLFDEPVQPLRQQYTHEHTKRWSETVSRADAFVFVILEYNHSMNAAIKNAVDYLDVEWRYKPFGIVCFGGGARGLRAAQALKPSLVALKMPLAGDVAISIKANPVVDDTFSADENLEKSATALLDELARLTPHFQALRA